MAAAFNNVSPDVRGASGATVLTREAYSVFVHLHNFVVQYERRVVKQFNTRITKVYLIFSYLERSVSLEMTYISIDVEVGLDGSRSAKQQLVFDNVRPRRLALDVDAIRATRHNVALFNQHQSLRQTLEHDTARLEVGKGALLNRNVCVNPQDASCVCVVYSVAFQVAHVHFEFRLWQGCDYRNFAVSLSENAAKILMSN
jgi:hypothetical protein